MTKVKGWHHEDIKAAIRKRGITLNELSLAAGLNECVARHALRRPLISGERAIANFLGVPAQELWPHRYNPDGSRRRRITEPTTNLARAKLHCIVKSAAAN
ncbi:MAG: helix-turn-helix transcriptional regulator [Proteobacteria bacterium]|nr:helix-turn-helix transcriptional regulator [Pseudomonadota bacterium]